MSVAKPGWMLFALAVTMAAIATVGLVYLVVGYVPSHAARLYGRGAAIPPSVEYALSLNRLFLRYLPRLLGLLGQMAPAIFVEHPTEQHYNFLHGALKVGGWSHYYLTALAVKTSIPFLAMAAEADQCRLEGSNRVARRHERLALIDRHSGRGRAQPLAGAFR